MNERFKKNKMARYLIDHGISFTAIKGEHRKKKVVSEREKSGRLDKKSKLFIVRKGMGSTFYLPEYKHDVVQKEIVLSDDYYEGDGLDATFSKIKPDNSGIALDIGANIGSHTLFFAKELGYKKVYSFEPIESTYGILKKNIEINNLENVVSPKMVGIGDHEYNTSVGRTIKNNRGGTALKLEEGGNIRVKTIDSFGFEKVTLMKIDTEGYEVGVLKGAVNTIKTCKPVILIEIDEKNMEHVLEMMKDWGYHSLYEKSGPNWVFVPNIA